MRLTATSLITGPAAPAERLGPGWAAAVPFFVLPALLLCPPDQRLLTVLASAAVCILAQSFLPGARFRANNYFSPVNVALVLLHLKILVVPVMLMTFGYSNKILALTASHTSIEGAIAIDTVAYVAFCVGLHFTSGRTATPGQFSLLTALSSTPSRSFIAVFAGLGLVGLFLTFGSVGRFLEYFSDPAAVVETKEGASIGEFLGTMLRPFFAFSLVTWWARVADGSRKNGSPWRPVAAGFAAAAGITIANLTFSFNRGAVVFPLLSLAAIYSLRVRRIPPIRTFVGLACCAPILLAIGSFRANSQLNKVAPNATREIDVSTAEFTESVLVYSGGPQLTAVFYENLDWGNKLYGGITLISSTFSPIPILGKGFRENAGPVVYNRAIYGSPGVDDQIPPFSAELFGNFHIAGVVVGFAGLSLLLATLESWLVAVRSTFGAFIIHYIAIWGAMLCVWSLSVYVQILFYFLGPVYLYLAVTHLRGWLQRTPAPVFHPQLGVTHQ